MEEPVELVVPAVALLLVPLEELEPDEPPTNPITPPFTPDELPSEAEVPLVELLLEPLDALEPPPTEEPPDQLVPLDSPVDMLCPTVEP